MSAVKEKKKTNGIFVKNVLMILGILNGMITKEGFTTFKERFGMTLKTMKSNL